MKLFSILTVSSLFFLLLNPFSFASDQSILINEINEMVIRNDRYMKKLALKMKEELFKVNKDQEGEEVFDTIYLGLKTVAYRFSLKTNSLSLHWKHRDNHLVAALSLAAVSEDVKDLPNFEDPQEVFPLPNVKKSRLTLLSGPNSDLEKYSEQFIEIDAASSEMDECPELVTGLKGRKIVIDHGRRTEGPVLRLAGTDIQIKDIRFFECDYIETGLFSLMTKGFSKYSVRIDEQSDWVSREVDPAE